MNIGNTETLKRLDQLPNPPVLRLRSGIDEIDWFFGRTVNKGIFWGLPEPALTLLTGRVGLGKARALLSIIGSVIHRFQNQIKILYFTKDANPGMIKQLMGNLPARDLYVSTSFNLKAMVAQINLLSRSHSRTLVLVVVDSLQIIEEFQNNSNSIHRIIHGDQTRNLMGLQEAAVLNRTHIILINHQNEGQPKKSPLMTHLVDVVIDAVPWDNEGRQPTRFAWKMTKNRFGPSGQWIAWRHTEQGALCESDWRLFDEEWCQNFGLHNKRLDLEKTRQEIEKAAQKRAKQTIRQTDELAIKMFGYGFWRRYLRYRPDPCDPRNIDVKDLLKKQNKGL